MSRFVLTVSILFISLFSLAQEVREISIKQTTKPVVIDGKIDDDAWLSIGVLEDINSKTGGNFTQTFPTDSLSALEDTYFRMSYDDDFIYALIISYDQKASEPIIQSLRRDFRWQNNDNVSLYLDPYNDQTNGFTFQVTPLNVQREGLVIFGGEVADDWDNKWYSETSIEDGYWVAEMAIPFTSIRYNETPFWGVQVLRNNLKLNERSVWSKVPLQYRSSDLVYAGKLNWDSPPPAAGTNISLIPYVAYSQSRDFETESQYSSSPTVGFDAKIGITNSLNLDLTVNPDFSQVEVDQQVTNLNRFEVFFPERRQFFLENQDLFAQNGFPPARPFFSRRIGIAQDNDGNNVQIPIIGGARLSGKIGKDWRVGALSMQTQKDESIFTPGQNYSLGVVQRQIFARSNISAVVVNRQSNIPINSDSSSVSEFNRVYGFDYNLASPDNKWQGNFFLHNSQDPTHKAGNFSSGGFLQYQVRDFSVNYFQILVGKNFNAEVGFVPRQGVYQQGVETRYNFYPSGGLIQRHGPQISASRVMTEDFDVLDKEVNLEWGLNFLNTAYVEFGANYNSVFLLNSFDPTRTDGEELPSDQIYEWVNFRFFGRTDRRKLFSTGLSASYGSFYNGYRTRLRHSIDYRLQPYFSISIDTEYNRVDLPSPFSSADLWLIGTRTDFTFTTKLFWTTFIQYNTQIENLGLNTRLQWRFKPVSDLFIVYTDNYDTVNFGVKNRALVVKLSYWFNL